MEKIKPMKQQRQQHKNLLWQFIQLNIQILLDIKADIYANIQMAIFGLNEEPYVMQCKLMLMRVAANQDSFCWR